MRAPTPVTSRPTCGPDDEDWEAEATVKVSYNPAEAAARKNVVRKIEGVVPSQRKAFRMKELERLRSLEKQESSDTEEEADETEDLKSNSLKSKKGKGVLLIKLRKMRDASQAKAQDISQSQDQEPSLPAKSNNYMKRRGVDLTKDHDSSELAPVSAKKTFSRGRGKKLNV